MERPARNRRIGSPNRRRDGPIGRYVSPKGFKILDCDDQHNAHYSHDSQFAPATHRPSHDCRSADDDNHGSSRALHHPACLATAFGKQLHDLADECRI